MIISRKFRILLTCLIPLSMLSSCTHRKRTSSELHKHGTNKIIAGSVTGAASLGVNQIAYNVANYAVFYGTGKFLVPALTTMAATFFIGLPITAVLIASGIKDRKKAKKLALLEEERLKNTAFKNKTDTEVTTPTEPRTLTAQQLQNTKCAA